MSSRTAGSLIQLGKELRTQRPGITLGFGRNDSDSDHDFYSVRDAKGYGVVRAVDIMGAGADYDRLAANLAAKLGKHPAMGHGAYVIHKQKIISTDRLGEGWRGMEDRGTATANHFDHVHVSVASAQGGYDYKGKWGALFGGSGTGAAPTPGDPSADLVSTTATNDNVPTSAVAAHDAANGGNGGAQPAADKGDGSDSVFGLPDVKELVAIGAALGLGVVLVVVGAARVAKPTTDAISKDAQSAALTVATRGAVK